MALDITTPEQYIQIHDCKPLTPNELNYGKNKLRISNTDEFLPWEEIYTRIAAGMDMENIAEIYGQGRKIALWAIRDQIKFIPEVASLVDDEITQRRKMAAISEESPQAASTIQEMANEYAPDVAKDIVIFAQKLIKEATDDLTRPKRTTLDLVNLSKAVQTASDTLGTTQRHASQASGPQATVLTGGWTFTLDTPPDQLEIIDTEALPHEPNDSPA